MPEQQYEDRVYDDETLVDPEPWDVDEQLAPRPRRRLVTPIRAGFVALVIAAAGFVGGVEVQKSQGSSGTSGTPTAFAGGTRPGGGGPVAFPGQSSDATIGTVKNKSGNSLYVQDSNGNTVKVQTNSNSKVTRTAKASASAIHPGDTVIVQGSKSSNGTVTATQITATSSTARTGAGGFLGRAFGGRPPGAGNGGSGG
jgi:hypothetical protein